MASVIAQLRALEDARRDGTIELPGGERLGVTNLWKIFWPAARLTKGDLLRYYATVSDYILPAVADRPLVMKRFPNGIDGMAFYQQRSRQEKPPPGVRIETLAPEIEPVSEPDARRFIGGSLITLLYMTQIAAISQDPWFSRVQSPLDADYVALDLDPGEGTTFARVLDVARWVHDELETLGVPAVPKTSGSRGLHVYIPLPPIRRTNRDALLPDRGDDDCGAAPEGRDRGAHRARPSARDGLRRLSAEHPGQDAGHGLQRPRQRFRGRLDAAHPGRRSTRASIRSAFTIVTAPERFREVGDLWARLRTAKPANLEAVFRKYQAGDVESAVRQTKQRPPERTTEKLNAG